MFSSKLAIFFFSETSYPTSNLYFNEVFKDKKKICEAYDVSSDTFMKIMTEAMFDKFEKYWGSWSFNVGCINVGS
jgi:Domain of unknown function (DUF4413)